MEKTISGKFAIVFIFGVGMAATVGGLWYVYHSHKSSLALWGGAEANLMLNAPLANALWLAPADKAPPGKLLPDEVRERITVGKEHLVVLKRKDVTVVPGFSHVRSWLVDDGSFDWNAQAGDCQPEWTYGLEFHDLDAMVTILLAPNCGRAMLVDTGASASIQPAMPAIVQFMKEQLPTNRATDPQK